MSEDDEKNEAAPKRARFDLDDDASEATVVSSAPSELLAKLRQEHRASHANESGEKVQSPTGEEVVDPQQLSMPTPLGSFAIVELDSGWDETTPTGATTPSAANAGAPSDKETPRAPAQPKEIASKIASKIVSNIAAPSESKRGLNPPESAEATSPTANASIEQREVKESQPQQRTGDRANESQPKLAEIAAGQKRVGGKLVLLVMLAIGVLILSAVIVAASLSKQ